METAVAFQALDRGQKPTLFSKRSDRDKERPHSPEREHHRRVAAAMLEVLATAGKEQRELAAARIARAVQKWRGIGKQQITAETIIGWRKQLSSKKDAEYLHIVTATLQDSDPVGAVNHFLKRLQGPDG
jgi:hypothetical protein